MVNLRELKKKFETDKTEITRHKGEYWVLHICNNNTPVPLFHNKNINEVKDYLELHYGGQK